MLQIVLHHYNKQNFLSVLKVIFYLNTAVNPPTLTKKSKISLVDVVPPDKENKQVLEVPPWQTSLHFKKLSRMPHVVTQGAIMSSGGVLKIRLNKRSQSVSQSVCTRNDSKQQNVERA